MEFIKTEGAVELTDALVAKLNEALELHDSVLWLVPGGSNIQIAIAVMDKLEETNLHKLTIALTDERYGEPGHKDSNYFQLHQNGFNKRSARFIDILKGEPFDRTIKESGEFYKEAIVNSDTVVGFFGMGPDGHIAGILPHSPAVSDEESWVAGYEAPPLFRMTLTPHALSYLSTAYVGAFGDEKRNQLETLRDRMLPIAQQPAQILRHLPEVYIYSNQIGE